MLLLDVQIGLSLCPKLAAGVVSCVETPLFVFGGSRLLWTRYETQDTWMCLDLLCMDVDFYCRAPWFESSSKLAVAVVLVVINPFRKLLKTCLLPDHALPDAESSP